MFILNKRNNKIQECHNADAIKICRQDSANYAVAETVEELLKEVAKKAQEQPETNAGREGMAEELKAAPEAAQEVQEGESEAPEAEEAQEAAGDGWEQLPEEEKVEALEAKTVSDLRKIAKEMGIQGYANMNKGTLVAMIMNH